MAEKDTFHLIDGAPADGIDINAVTWAGHPLHFAIRTRRIKVKYNTKGFSSSYFQNRADIAEQLLKGGAKPGTTDMKGRTPLHFAAQATKQLVRLLLEFGADSNTKDTFGNTALHYAIGRCEMNYEFEDDDDGTAFTRGLRDVVTSEKCAIVVELLTHGADVNAMRNKEQTPWYSYSPKTNKEGMTPLDIAHNINNEPVVKLLSTMGPARLEDA
ncbi:ankyrin repeat-containing domain protein [Trichophaea hybrida]|nr:ankyrin repeat-containing domain protein [Trichophaea hybrida]